MSMQPGLLASERCLSTIRRWEGFMPQTYRCPSGILTIGFGHTGPDVTPGAKITLQEGLALFSKDILHSETVIDAHVERRALAQGKFDALTSFVFNVGSTAFIGSTLLKLINTNAPSSEIQEQFQKWVHDSYNRALPGLLKRRKQEAIWWAE